MCQSSRLESAGRASVGSAGALPVLQLLAQAGHVVRCAAAHRDHVQPVGEADWASIPSGPVLDQVLQRQVSRVGHQEVSSLHLVAGCHSRLLALHCLAGAHFSSSVKAAKVARTLPATAAAGRGAPVHVIHCALIRRDLGAPRRLEEFARIRHLGRLARRKGHARVLTAAGWRWRLAHRSQSWGRHASQHSTCAGAHLHGCSRRHPKCRRVSCHCNGSGITWHAGCPRRAAGPSHNAVHRCSGACRLHRWPRAAQEHSHLIA
mmetsp:Transcript_56080/g.121293  ORF Transcript_56080/g.121293 Transcript_56080/m.121293 type:complete len:262 (+) Transcript_56080:409-1194(+)